MKQIIDIETWERRDNYRFFRGFLNPCISITSEIECGIAKEKAHVNKQSFFLYYLYAILRAANEIKELRYRFDAKEQVILYDKVDVLAPVKMNEKGKFYTVRIPWIEDFEKFHGVASAIIRDIPEDGDPYAAENGASEDERYNVILVSATPDLFFTSVTHTQQHKNGGDYPLINVGKAVIRGGSLVIPIALYVNHSFVDGVHIADFYKRVEQYLR